MQAWLGIEGVDLATIGFLSLVGLPYTFKFLWAPLMDRFEPPWLGRRRGWLVLTQLALAATLAWLAETSPRGAIGAFAAIAFLIAFLSAAQDVVVDAYRTDLLLPAERGLGSSLAVLGYRLAMIVSGGIALIWVDPAQGGGWSWPEVYRVMAALMLGAAVISATLLPRLRGAVAPRSEAGNDLRGFVAVVVAVVVGAAIATQIGRPLLLWLVASVGAPAVAGTPGARWLDLGVLLIGLGITVPLAAWAARLARFETLLGGLRDYFAQPGARGFLAFVVLYKLGDAFAFSLMTPFLLQSMHYGPAEVGVVNKVIGLWLTIGGALVGGLLMIRLGLWRSLFVFGVLQMVSNVGFWWLAVHGKGALPGLVIPAFDFGIVRLAQATPVDGGLLIAVAGENIASGMGTAAFLAFLTALCNRRYSATQFALLSAFASVGRVWVGPFAGVLALAIGWPAFFIVAMIVSVPALVLLVALRGEVRALGQGA
ncbi:MAG: MFS transporter [Pseudomonadota bacterium]|nr:MFS transporter [Pseudomonadota bacterium]